MALFVVKNLILLLKEMDLLFLSENMLNRKYIKYKENKFSISTQLPNSKKTS